MKKKKKGENLLIGSFFKQSDKLYKKKENYYKAAVDEGVLSLIGVSFVGK